MTSAQQQATLTGTGCDVAFDNLTSQLYATDASIYQIEPVGVAFPRNARQASAIIEAAAQTGIPVTPRGAGTGLVGGAIGDGLVIDFSRHNRQISDLDPERRTVRVGPGVILDHLNNFLRPQGFCFGPDVATSSRATLGGMIANNSSGSHTPVYGTTADHVSELEIVMADGRLTVVGPGHDTLRKQRDLAVLLITHDLGVVAEVADRVAVMYTGRIVEESPVDELFARPKHPYTEGLLRSVPKLTSEHVAKLERLETIEGTVPRPTDLPPGCHFAPRCVHRMPRCTEDDIPLYELEGGVTVRCVLYDLAAAVAADHDSCQERDFKG